MDGSRNSLRSTRDSWTTVRLNLRSTSGSWIIVVIVSGVPVVSG